MAAGKRSGGQVLFGDFRIRLRVLDNRSFRLGRCSFAKTRSLPASRAGSTPAPVPGNCVLDNVGQLAHVPRHRMGDEPFLEPRFRCAKLFLGFDAELAEKIVRQAGMSSLPLSQWVEAQGV